MAKMDMKKGPKKEYVNHPTGTFEGYIREVVKDSTKEYPNDDGTVTIAERRRWLVENCDGKAEFTMEKDGQDVTLTHRVRTAPLNFYINPDGSYRIPGDKSALHDYYTTALGEVPDWENFDDETVLGIHLIYQIIHVPGTDKDGDPVTYANIKSIMKSQNTVVESDVTTQAQRAEFEENEDTSFDHGANKPKPEAQEAPQHDQGNREAPVNGETKKFQLGAALQWITHLELKGVYAVAQGHSYRAYTEGAELEDLKAFNEKCAKDCADANMPAPTPHPLSTAGDDLPL
jgi:hypothetical protein